MIVEVCSGVQGLQATTSQPAVSSSLQPTSAAALPGPQQSVAVMSAPQPPAAVVAPWSAVTSSSQPAFNKVLDCHISVSTFYMHSKARHPSTSWTAATPHRTLPVVSDFDLLAATISSYHDIVAARSAVGHSPSPVRWPGMRCLTTSETRRSVPTISGRC